MWHRAIGIFEVKSLCSYGFERVGNLFRHGFRCSNIERSVTNFINEMCFGRWSPTTFASYSAKHDFIMRPQLFDSLFIRITDMSWRMNRDGLNLVPKFFHRGAVKIGERSKARGISPDNCDCQFGIKARCSNNRFWSSTNADS